MTQSPALIAHLKGRGLICVSFWNNTVSLGRGEAHGDGGELFPALSGAAAMND